MMLKVKLISKYILMHLLRFMSKEIEMLFSKKLSNIIKLLEELAHECEKNGSLLSDTDEKKMFWFHREQLLKLSLRIMDDFPMNIEIKEK